MSARALTLAAFWFAVNGAAAQDPVIVDAVAALESADPQEVELARRRLCGVHRDALPVQQLTRMLALGEMTARASSSVLRYHGLAEGARRTLLAREEVALQREALDLASVTQLTERLRDPASSLRLAAFWSLFDRGALDEQQLAAVLDDDDAEVARAAARTLVLEASPFPVAVMQRLSRRARYRVIRQLSERPRAAASRWLERKLDAEVFEGRERLYAIAALNPDAITLEQGRQLLAVAADRTFAVAAQVAAMRMPSEVVDRLVGHAHARLQAGQAVETVLGCLENATPLGERQVLSLSRVLPTEDVDYICQWLASRGSSGLQDHIASALDGEVPLEPHLLRRAGPLIDSPLRVERVLELLRDGSSAEKTAAFYALVDAGVYRAEMLDYAQSSETGDHGEWSNRTQRLRALLRVPLQQFPGPVLLGLLADGEQRVRLAVCRALATAPYPEAVQDELLDRAATGADPIAAAAARAIATFGSRAAVAELWRRGAPKARVAVIDWLQARPEPWTTTLLRDALDELGEPDDESDREFRDELSWGLAMLGDAAAVDQLLARVAELPVGLVRRCRPFAPAALDDQRVARLTGHLLGSLAPLPPASREEVVDWLASRPDLEVEPTLLQLYRGDEVGEVRLAALSGLLRTDGAVEFHARLREAMQRPFGPDERDLAYELLANVPNPARPMDLDTIARLLLLAPLSDPEAECARSMGEFPRSGDYPLNLPIVDVLRRQGELDPTPFSAPLMLLADHPGLYALSGRRLGHALSEMVRFPALRRTVAPILASLVGVASDEPQRFAGLAHMIMGEEAEELGAWAEAADHYAIAAPALLREPLPPLLQRSLLGDVDLAAGVLPEAALVARQHICRARAAIDDGRGDDARESLAVALDLAAEDLETEREVDDLLRRLER